MLGLDSQRCFQPGLTSRNQAGTDDPCHESNRVFKGGAAFCVVDTKLSGGHALWTRRNPCLSTRQHAVVKSVLRRDRCYGVRVRIRIQVKVTNRDRVRVRVQRVSDRVRVRVRFGVAIRTLTLTLKP